MVMNGSNTVLLVENDVNTAMPLITGLQDEGFRALHARDGRQGLAYVRAAQADLVLLDAMPPRMDGFAVCRTLRQESAVPIIMLDDRGWERDRIRGLEIGADDYVAKPFSLRVLAARMRALLRRRELDRRSASPPADRIAVVEIEVDRTTRQVWRAGLSR